MGTQAAHEGVHEAVCTQPAFAGGALFVTRVPAALQVGAPLAIGAQPALPVWAQSAELAADWDEKDANTLLKFSSRPRFCESAGNKIKGFVAELKLYLRMCGRPVNRWGYFLMGSLGAEEAEKVRRSPFADAIADYPKFKTGVETLFGKFEFEVSVSAQLRNHAQSGAESIAAYAARITEVCSKAYSAFATETQLLLAVDYFIASLADKTTRDYLLHDRALRTLTWQECVQMAQAC